MIKYVWIAHCHTVYNTNGAFMYVYIYYCYGSSIVFFRRHTNALAHTHTHTHIYIQSLIGRHINAVTTMIQSTNFYFLLHEIRSNKNYT